MSRLAWILLAVAACSHHDAPPADRAPATAAAPPAATAPPPAAPPSGKVVKDPELARKMIAEGAIVLDVRTPDEYDGGHLANATNVPIDELGGRIAEVDKLVAGDKSRPVVVYCASGVRAGHAKTQLEAAGYGHVVDGGGYDDLR